MTQRVLTHKEQGLTIIEIVFTIVVIGFLVAIAVPGYHYVQNRIEVQSIKAELINAATLIEQEQIDNNGLYPTYVPNEMKTNPRMAGFVYTHSESRKSFCVEADTPDGTLYTSSAGNKEPTSTSCTQEIIAEGSPKPWQDPTIATPSISSIASTWNAPALAAQSVVAISATSCVFTGSDIATWGSRTTVEYSVKLNNTTLGDTISTPWGTSRSVTAVLTGWAPANSVTYTVQARCVTENGTNYYKNSDTSAGTVKIVPNFVLAAPSISTATVNWPATSATATYNASWADFTCPLGTKQYRLVISDVGTSISQGTGWKAYVATESSSLNTAWTAGGNTKFDLTYACVLPSGTRISSTTVSKTVLTPSKAPAAPTSITSRVWSTATQASPNGIAWTGVVCPSGIAQYRVSTSAPTISVGSWLTTLYADLNPSPATTYKYTVAARCYVSDTNYSDTSAESAPYTVTTTWLNTTAPTNAPTITGNVTTRPAGQAFPVTVLAYACPTGGTPVYRLYSNNVVTGTYTTNSFNFTPTVAGAYQLKYTVSCTFSTGSSRETTASPITAVTATAGNLPPTNLRVLRIVGETATVAWDYQDASTGMTITSSTAGAWFTSNPAVTQLDVSLPILNKNWLPFQTQTNEAQPVLEFVSWGVSGSTTAAPSAYLTVPMPRSALYQSTQDQVLTPLNTTASMNSWATIDTRFGNSLVSPTGKQVFIMTGADRDMKLFKNTQSAPIFSGRDKLAHGPIDRVIMTGAGVFKHQELSSSSTWLDKWCAEACSGTNFGAVIMDDNIPGPLLFRKSDVITEPFTYM